MSEYEQNKNQTEVLFSEGFLIKRSLVISNIQKCDVLKTTCF